VASISRETWLTIGVLAEAFAELQTEYPQLADVELRIDPKMKTLLGCCTWCLGTGLRDAILNPNAKHRPFEVKVARWVVEADAAVAMDTLLHETAHALAGPKAYHGPVWKAWARKLGAKPERCAPRDSPVSPGKANAKWEWSCPTCGVTDTRQRRSKRDATYYHCPKSAGAEPISWRALR